MVGVEVCYWLAQLLLLYDQFLQPIQCNSDDWILYLQCNFFFPEYKKARQEIKKAASDTMRLQKKVKKGQ